MNSRIARIFLTFFIALCSGAVTAELVKQGPLKKADLITILAEASSPTQVIVNIGSVDANSGKFHLNGGLKRIIQANKPTKLTYRNYSYLGNRLQLEIERPTSILITEVSIFNSAAGTSLSFRGEQLLGLFGNGNARVSTRAQGNAVRLNVTAHKAELLLATDLHQQNNRLRYGIAIVVAAFIFFLLQHARPLSIAAISDIVPAPDSARKIELDGLRGFAALLVILEHTWAPFAGAGATGVWLFFILSGYLLALPFVKQPSRAIDYHYVGPYLVRRVARIVPMYFFVIVVIYGLGSEAPHMIEHLLFLRADGHFWTIPQELVFYVFLPAIMFFGWANTLISRSMLFPAMLGLCLLFLWQPDIIGISMPGDGRPPYIGWFMLGIVVASINPLLTKWSSTINKPTTTIVNAIGFFLFCMLMIGSCYGFTATYVVGSGTLPVIFPRLFGILCALVLISLLISPTSWLAAIMRLKILRAIGIVGYSFYLIHPFIINFITSFSIKFWAVPLTGFWLFIVATMLTWLVSLFTYTTIERPFLSKKTILASSADSREATAILNHPIAQKD